MAHRSYFRSRFATQTPGEDVPVGKGCVELTRGLELRGRERALMTITFGLIIRGVSVETGAFRHEVVDLQTVPALDPAPDAALVEIPGTAPTYAFDSQAPIESLIVCLPDFFHSAPLLFLIIPFTISYIPRMSETI